jgi:hypothetical protein
METVSIVLHYVVNITEQITKPDDRIARSEEQMKNIRRLVPALYVYMKYTSNNERRTKCQNASN